MPNEVSGMDRRTLKRLSGWPYVLQCVEVIFTTGYFSRVMRPHVGSSIPGLIGRLANARNVQRTRWAMALALLLFVPNFKPTRIGIVSLDETGAAGWTVDGVYYPRGHKGDFTGGQAKSLALDGGAGTIAGTMS
jgi:phage baseplate assembly protein W